jgi:hypothetical protein
VGHKWEGMQTTACQTEASGKRVKRSPKIEVPLLDRAAVTLNECSALFGKQTTWAYRLAYAGKLRVIRDLGRMMVPRSEIQRLMSNAEVLS